MDNRPVTPLVEKRPSPPLEVLKRRLDRLALGGEVTLRASGNPDIAREKALLSKLMMPTGVVMLQNLQAAATLKKRDMFGVQTSKTSVLPMVWLQAMTYERTATRKFLQSLW